MTDRCTTPSLSPDDDIIEFLRSTDFDVRIQVSAYFAIIPKSFCKN